MLMFKSTHNQASELNAYVYSLIASAVLVMITIEIYIFFIMNHIKYQFYQQYGELTTKYIIIRVVNKKYYTFY